MRRQLLPGLWLVVVWVALWEDVSVANVVGGALVATLALSISRRSPVAEDERGRFRPLAAARFFLWFLWKLVEASAIVAWEVVTPTNDINEGIVAVPLRGPSRIVTAVVSNAITLTPGTLTIEVRSHPTILYVHVLHLRTIEEVRLEVRHLERLAIRAFGTDAAVAALDADEAAGLTRPERSAR